MNIPNPEETERVSLNTLEENNREGIASLRAITEKGRTLTPEEIVAVLNSLNALDHRHYSTYASTAHALSALGRPSLSQRLAQVRQDIRQNITLYSDMYRKAVEFDTEWGELQQGKVIRGAISKLSTADPSNVQDIIASQRAKAESW